MYLDFLVKVPEVHGKITIQIKNGIRYVNYEYERDYIPEKQYTKVKRVAIGKLSDGDLSMMLPNENFLKYFPDEQLPEEKDRLHRSSCLRIGGYLVIKKIIEEYKLSEMLEKYFSKRDCGLFLDLATYSVICESNVSQYYPDYAYDHALFTPKMRMYSDSTVSSFLSKITTDQKIEFLNEWNTGRNHREKIYISYDSTNKNSQAGDLELVEYGHPKVDKGLPVFNYSIAYDKYNSEPLFYEEYPGSIVDVAQLQDMLEKAKGYGYKKIGFILDRGYFSKKNLDYMDDCGYDFIIMVKGMAALVDHLILENKDTFEDDHDCSIREFKVYGTTIRKRVYESDKKNRYIHLFYSDIKKAKEREALENKIEKMENGLKRLIGKPVERRPACDHYFESFCGNDGLLAAVHARKDVLKREMSLCGYFAIITSQKMTAKEAISIYKSRDASEKVFMSDKSFLGNNALRVQTDERTSAKIFIEFVALIIRCRIYQKLKEALARSEKRANFMDVPAAVKELEKIEMIRQLDNVYRKDHAVTANQKIILSAFGIDEAYVNYYAKEISNQLVEISNDKSGKKA